MATARDRLQAHQFLLQRTVSALVTRETDPEQPPFRLPSGAAVGGVVLAVIGLAAAGVYGLLSPGGDRSWQDGKSVVVEKETGTRYVYLNGKLDPVANYASALLALGTHAPTASVSANSLAGVPRGPRIGIQDAPDALPGADRVLTGGWTLCSQPGTDLAGASTYRSALFTGHQPPGGTPLGERGLLVRTPESGDEYLVSGGYRHRIAAEDAVTVGLALGSAPVSRVGAAVVDVLPEGAPVLPIPVPDAGKPSQAVPGRPDVLAGQLLALENQHYLAESGQLRPISPLEYEIQRAYRPTTVAYGGAEPFPVRLSPIELSGAKVADRPAKSGRDLPSARPEFAPAVDDHVCLAFDPASFVPRVSVDAVLPEPATTTAGRTTGGVALADQVVVPPGTAAVVEVLASERAPAGTYAVVTDLGRAYPLGSADVLGYLGYTGIRPVRIPAALMARVPQGPGLDHDAAMRQW
ncbi:type VII secretion protein EccB [Amycolatopsis jiangsuensis]|uniref:Type VII secretion protein EccB n=1 Tax=Amycolatopsis jiangsuensis TaxID=1181879 RepID=A0A840J2V8_9PSEU|nr:type VII secretion protein EccB [Amycolatopsis jiangsuensis]MBB4688390.1 type VII secretion protein EccB [Amycolatopsis jiangsuensis]